MQIWGTTPAQVSQALDEANLHYKGNLCFKTGPSLLGATGRSLTTTLTVKRCLGVRKRTLPGVRRSTTGRRIAAACWHAHRDFMRALFKLAPSARIKSAFADYRNSAAFEAEHWGTGSRNIGSQYQPFSYEDGCDCGLNTGNFDK